MDETVSGGLNPAQTRLLELENQLGASEMHVFDGTGHCPMWEEPERFNALVAEWVAGLSG